MNPRLALFASSVFIFFACGTGTSSNPAGSADVGGSKSELLVGKDWKPVSAVLDPGIRVKGALVTDLYALVDACEKEGSTKYSGNGAYAYIKSSSACATGEPSRLSGSWTMDPDGKVLTQTEAGGTPIQLDIVEMTSTSLVVSNLSSDLGDGLPHKITVGFAAKEI